MSIQHLMLVLNIAIWLKCKNGYKVERRKKEKKCLKNQKIILKMGVWFLDLYMFLVFWVFFYLFLFAPHLPLCFYVKSPKRLCRLFSASVHKWMMHTRQHVDWWLINSCCEIYMSISGAHLNKTPAISNTVIFKKIYIYYVGLL